MLDTCLWEVSKGTLTTQEAQGPPHWQRVGWEAWLGPGQLAAHGRALSPLIQAP